MINTRDGIRTKIPANILADIARAICTIKTREWGGSLCRMRLRRFEYVKELIIIDS